MTDYKVPSVWEWEDANTNKSGNRPTAGSRFKQKLPVGDAPLQVYSLGTPNGVKVTIMLEELREIGKIEAAYDLYQIHIGEGEQFGSGFVSISPNSKIPAMVDQSQTPPVNLFESGSILVYLAEKFDAFLPKEIHGKTEVLNWLFWQVGSGPFVGGGFGHFFRYAPEKLKYSIDRYTMETKRQLDLLDKLLATRAFIAGDDYTIADIANWSWYGQLVLGDLYDGAAEFLDVGNYQHVIEWAHKVADRPAVKRGMTVDYHSIVDS